MRTLSHGEESAPTIPDYELLRRIGQGSYGDVWLARGLTGVYRAIKIVWRDRFPDAEPFEREFKGLKKFMAMSLPEAGQLSLLHVGQNETAGFFYYVMELADDAERGREIVPASYVPLTLTEVRRRKGRLPAKECVAIGTELARALAGLHSRSLVHRDIKPSNVILVGGVPKLADIGLVASTADAQTYVGTQGFVPPEGPGKPAADVFALGRLLYELATGLDREEFPRLPPELNQVPDHKVLFGLNEVILRACEADVKQRYADGSGMLADLLVLQAGSSVRTRKLRRWAAMAAGLLVMAGAGLWWRSRPAPVSPEPAAPVAAAKSIAVLPFENLSDDKSNGYLADGLQDDVLTNLAGVRGLKVAPRASVLHYRGTTKTMKQVGTELNVAYILNASVRREGSRIRMTAQLTDARTDQQVWAQSFDREMSGMLVLQSELAGEIVPALQVVLSPEEKATLAKGPTSSESAYELYLRARALRETNAYIEKGASEQALVLLKQAVADDPGFVRAWVEIATLHTDQYFQGVDGRSAKRIAAAEEAVATARRLAPEAPEVLLAQGRIRYYCYADYAGAMYFYQRILAAYPKYPDLRLALGLLYRRLGRWPEALAELREAFRQEPGNRSTVVSLLLTLLWVRRIEEAQVVFREAFGLMPTNTELRFGGALLAFRVRGSRLEFEQWLAALPADQRETPGILDHRVEWAMMCDDRAMVLELIRQHGATTEKLGALMVLIHAGQRPKALELLEKLKPELDHNLETDPLTANNWTALAEYHALRGERAATLEAIEHARQLMPESADVINGTTVSQECTFALAWLGDKEAALAEIDRLVKKPGGPNGWQLRHWLVWLPLRGDPRFEAIASDPKNDEVLF